MTTYYTDDSVTLYHGDCVDVLRALPDVSVDAVVTDPPYGLTNRTPDVKGCTVCGRTLGGGDGHPERCPRCGGGLTYQRSAQGKGFMGKEWDGTGIAFRPEVWVECLRVLKPGGHLLAFGGTRTSHRLTCAIEDAGFEIRDSIAWLYGSGFPKSLDVSKAIDKAAGAEREEYVDPQWAERYPNGPGGNNNPSSIGADGRGGSTLRRDAIRTSDPVTDDARTWQGWGTALKPAHEPVVVARKPLAGTVAANVLAHGTGALNVDGCRIDGAPAPTRFDPARHSHDGWRHTTSGAETAVAAEGNGGRWPANVVLDESQAAELDKQSGEQRDGVAVRHNVGKSGGNFPFGAANPDMREDVSYGGEGGASRFFYTAKANSTERVRLDDAAHPTVKPLALMRWLVRLVTPPDGLVCDPFAGSGTTVEACILEGFRCIAIERETDYLPLIVQRINRRRNPVAAVRATGEDPGLFDLLDDGGTA